MASQRPSHRLLSDGMCRIHVSGTSRSVCWQGSPQQPSTPHQSEVLLAFCGLRHSCIDRACIGGERESLMHTKCMQSVEEPVACKGLPLPGRRPEGRATRLGILNALFSPRHWAPPSARERQGGAARRAAKTGSNVWDWLLLGQGLAG